MSVETSDTTQEDSTLTPGHRLVIEPDDAEANTLAGLESEHVGVLVWTDGEFVPETIEALLADVGEGLAARAGDGDV